MILIPSLTEVLSQPTPEALWLLRADLLEQGMQDDARLAAVIDAFFRFLNQLVASSTAREYSHLASILWPVLPPRICWRKRAARIGGSDSWPARSARA